MSFFSSPAEASGEQARLGAAMVAGVLAAIALALLAFAPSAFAEHAICEPGSEPFQCTDPRGVATDFESGRLYVADRGNDQIDVFEADGTYEASFEDGFTSLGPLAVHNGPGENWIYVVDGGEVRKVDPTTGEAVKTISAEFKSIQGIGVSDNGTVHVIDTENLGPCSLPEVGGSEFRKRVHRLNDEGTVLDTVEPTNAPCGGVWGFAVDSAGAFYIANQGPTGAIRKYEPSGAPLCTVEPPASALAVDESNRLYAVQSWSRKATIGSRRAVTKYATGCGGESDVERRYGYGDIHTNLAKGLAVRESPQSEAFATEENATARHVADPIAGPIVASPSVVAPPTEVGNSNAILEAEVNPEGEATEYRFEYVDQQSFEESGYATALSTPSESLDEGADDFQLHLATALAGCADPLSEEGHPGETAAEAGECLTPLTTYRFRVVAENADGEGNSPVEGSFETGPPGEIVETFATEVGADTARLNTVVDPSGLPTRGFFEYVPQATCEEDEEAAEEEPETHCFDSAIKVPDPEAEPPQGELDFGAGKGNVRRSVVLDLEPDTAYRFRAVITGPLLEEPLVGEEALFATFAVQSAEPGCANDPFRTGPAALLPDCRAYEMVSPLDKEGGHLFSLTSPGGLRATLDQSAVSGDKFAYGSYRSFGDASSAPYTSQYIAERDSGGWQSHNILGVRTVNDIEPVLALNTELKLLSPDLCEGWIRTVAEPVLAPGAVEGFTNIYRRSDESCGEERWTALTTVEPTREISSMELQGVSSDGVAAIYAMVDALPGTGAPTLDEGEAGLQLYFQGPDAGPTYVCILPSGEATGPCTAGVSYSEDGESYVNNVDNALSADGSRVFWTAGGHGPGEIYMRLNPGEDQSATNPSGECTEPQKACTVAVSKVAQEQSGVTESRYWGASADGSAVFFTAEDFFGGTSDLYLYNAETQVPNLVAGGVFGVMGASDNAAQIYFVSDEVLTIGANAQGLQPNEGQPNLYLFRDGEYRFIGTLLEKDLNSVFSAAGSEPRDRTARVTLDGDHATFMSAARLTGFDSTDGENGEADSEVFLYDAQAEGGNGRLICASCNPSGARPVGQNIEYKGNEFWAAAWLPAWSNVLYAPRVLAEDGSRLFFTSSDALSPLDSNGVADVYQWEAPGTDRCEVGAADYFAANEGCVRLISSGKSAHEAEFLDASPTGDDVFFATLAGLVSADYGLVDIYDARVEGGFPAPPAAARECEGEECLSPAAPPPALSRASESYEGPGDLAASAERCNRPASRAQHLSRRAGKLRRAARHAARRQRANAKAARRARALRRKASRSATAARKHSVHAKRCRARGRAGR